MSQSNLILQWLGTYAIHSTLLIGAVWLALRILPRLGHGARDMLWKLALVGGIASATLQTSSGVEPLFGTLQLEAPVTPAEPAVETPAMPIAPVPSPAPEFELAALGPEPVQPLGAGPMLAPEPAAAPRLEIEPAVAPAAPVTSPATDTDWTWLLVGAWSVIAAFLLFRLAFAYRRLRLGLGRRRPVSDPRLLHAVELLRSRAGLERRISLSVAPHLSSPVALGRSEICLTTRIVEELSTPEVTSVLAHELAHLERRDPLWLLFAAFCEAVFFFQPLNRVARRGIQESAEYLCDDWAVARTGSGLELAQSLARVAAWGRPIDDAPFLPAMARKGGPLVRRVGRLLDDTRPLEREQAPRWRAVISLATMAGLVAFAPGIVNANGPGEDDSVTVVIVGDDDEPRVLHISSDEIDEMDGELVIPLDDEDEDRARKKRKKRRAKRAKKAKKGKKGKTPQRVGAGEAHDGAHGYRFESDGNTVRIEVLGDNDEETIMIVPEVGAHVVVPKVPHVVIPPMNLDFDEDEWEDWAEDLERQLEGLEDYELEWHHESHPQGHKHKKHKKKKKHKKHKKAHKHPKAKSYSYHYPEWNEVAREAMRQAEELQREARELQRERGADSEEYARHYREQAERQREAMDRYRERMERDRDRMQKQREEAVRRYMERQERHERELERKHRSSDRDLERRLIEEAERAKEQARRAKEREERLRKRAEELKKRRQKSGEAERL